MLLGTTWFPWILRKPSSTLVNEDISITGLIHTGFIKILCDGLWVFWTRILAWLWSFQSLVAYHGMDVQTDLLTEDGAERETWLTLKFIQSEMVKDPGNKQNPWLCASLWFQFAALKVNWLCIVKEQTPSSLKDFTHPAINWRKWPPNISMWVMHLDREIHLLKWSMVPEIF